MRKQMQMGLTLIEVMVVIVISGIITSASLITLGKAGHKYRLKSSTYDIKQTIDYVRQYALEKNRTYGVDFKNGFITVFNLSDTDTTVESSNALPPNIKIGVNGNVTFGIDGTTLPESGTTFPNDKFLAYTHKGVMTGVIYFSSPNETRAFKINSLGFAKLYEWGGGDWHEH